MPMCFPKIEYKVKFVNPSTRLRKTVCTIYGREDSYDSPTIMGGPAVISYVISKRGHDYLKNAYIKLGSVPIGWFNSTEEQGLYLEQITLPKPFRWKVRWPTIDKLVDCDIPKKIKEEFGIRIEEYLRI